LKGTEEEIKDDGRKVRQKTRKKGNGERAEGHS
jgi:hypothetical protein